MHRTVAAKGRTIRFEPAWWVLALVMLAYGGPAQSGAWETIHPGGGTSCATGTPFSFHVREADPDRLMIFFNGGGACWSAGTCDLENPSGGEPTYRPIASAAMGNDPRTYDGAFALANPDNPFKDWSQVFVSYCTGDVHLGNADTVYRRENGEEFTIRHRGRVNAEAALDHVFARFPEPARVFVSGGSAGAVSSPVFAALLADHYRDAEIVHFAGGGGGYRLPPPSNLWRAWGVFDGLPDIFSDRYTAQNTSMTDLYRMAAEVFPDIAFHQYDSAYDAVQEQFHALLGVPVELLPGSAANRAELAAALPQFRSYTAPGEFHTLLRYQELYTRETNGVRALDWISAIASGAPVKNVTCGSAGQCR